MKRILLTTVSALTFTLIAAQSAQASGEVATYTTGTSIAVGEENPSTPVKKAVVKKMVKAKKKIRPLPIISTPPRTIQPIKAPPVTTQPVKPVVTTSPIKPIGGTDPIRSTEPVPPAANDGAPVTKTPIREGGPTTSIVKEPLTPIKADYTVDANNVVRDAKGTIIGKLSTDGNTIYGSNGLVYNKDGNTFYNSTDSSIQLTISAPKVAPPKAPVATQPVKPVVTTTPLTPAYKDYLKQYDPSRGVPQASPADYGSLQEIVARQRELGARAGDKTNPPSAAELTRIQNEYKALEREMREVQYKILGGKQMPIPTGRLPSGFTVLADGSVKNPHGEIVGSIGKYSGRFYDLNGHNQGEDWVNMKKAVFAGMSDTSIPAVPGKGYVVIDDPILNPTRVIDDGKMPPTGTVSQRNAYVVDNGGVVHKTNDPLPGPAPAAYGYSINVDGRVTDKDGYYLFTYKDGVFLDGKTVITDKAVVEQFKNILAGIQNPSATPRPINPNPSTTQPVPQSFIVTLPPVGKVKTLSNGNTIDSDGAIKDVHGTFLGRILENGLLLNVSGKPIDTAPEKTSLLLAAGATTNPVRARGIATVDNASNGGTARAIGAGVVPTPETKVSINAQQSYYGNNDDLSAQVASVKATLAASGARIPKPTKGETFAIGGTGYKMDSSGVLTDPYGSKVAKYNFTTGNYTQLNGKPFLNGEDRHYGSLYASAITAQQDPVKTSANVQAFLEQLNQLDPSSATLDKFTNDSFYSTNGAPADATNIARVSTLFVADLRRQVASQYNEMNEAQQHEFDQALQLRANAIAKNVINKAAAVARITADSSIKPSTDLPPKTPVETLTEIRPSTDIPRKTDPVWEEK